MKKKGFKYIYGPVPSWRLGSSLGIDLLSGKEKACTFNCLYCQLGRRKALAAERKLYVSTAKIIEEIKRLPKARIDYITFSGRGEPTLAANLGEAIRAIKKLRKEPVAVLTNASLLYRKEVRKELALADLVAVKLDGDCQKLLRLINQPTERIKFSGILKGIKQFRKEYRGKLALQIMFMKENKKAAANLAELARAIRPDEVQINTPRRPSAAKPLPPKELSRIKRYFCGLEVVSVYDVRHKKVQPISTKDTLLRRGKVLP